MPISALEKSSNERHAFADIFARPPSPGDDPICRITATQAGDAAAALHSYGYAHWGIAKLHEAGVQCIEM